MDFDNLPDPRDRNAPWADDIPAYQAWGRAINEVSSNFHDRQSIVEKFGLLGHYGENVLDRHSLEVIADLGPIHEFGAGNGYVARLLHDLGVDIVASDPQPRKDLWFDVVEGAYRDDPGRTALLVWPFMNAPTEWLKSALRPSQLLTVSDVPSTKRSAFGGYSVELQANWTPVQSNATQDGWRLGPDYLTLWEPM